MAHCKICGDENYLHGPLRYWDCDDGWVIGKLCDYCTAHYAHRKPKKDDYAYDEKSQFVSDEQGAIDAIYG